MSFRAALPLFVIFLCASSAHAQGSFVNFETPPVHPIEMTPDGATLLVCNTADARLEVFSLTSGAPVWIRAIPVGLDPVSVRARSNTQAWVVNKISDSISIVDLTTANVSATLATGDEPSDVVFAGTPQRAFVSVSGLNQVRVFDPANLAAAPQLVSIAGHQPRSLVTDGTRVFAAIFFAGNRSIVIPKSIVSDPTGPAGGQNPPTNTPTDFNPPMNPDLPPPPPTGLIVNRETVSGVEHWKDEAGRFWDGKVTWGLNQNAVAIINASTLGVTYVRNIGNLQMNLAVQPGTGRISVTQLYLRNEERFEPTMQRHFARNRIGLINPTSPGSVGIADVNPHLFLSPPNPAAYKTTVTPTERHMSLSNLRGHVWTSSSIVYISGMDSNNIGKFSMTTSLTRLATIDVGQGPTGLAYDAARNRIYCLNRFDGTLSVINTVTDAEIFPRIPFHDPTPQVIRIGRPMLYDSHATSRLGQASCVSCHVDGHSDMQAWDVGDPAGILATFDAQCFDGISPAGTCQDWHPMKGPMVTQTLAGIIGAGPMHWRGDRADIQAFKVGFTGFLGLSPPPSETQMAQLGDFLATIRFPPNPNRTFTDGLPASVAGYSGNPAHGQSLFNAPLLNNASVSCVQCHALPSGGGTTIVSAGLLNGSQGVKTPHLRDLYRKTGFSYALPDNNRAFGYLHDGSADNIFNLLANHVFPFPAGATNVPDRRDLEAFLVCFPTGTHPAVGVQVTVDAANKSSPAVTSQINAMIALASAGSVGVVAKGAIAGVPRGYAYDPASGAFLSDRRTQSITATSLQQSATTGGEITFTVVPAGTQIRIGLDRDEDGYFDRDEIDAGTDPNNAASHLPYHLGDLNLDGTVTAADAPLFAAVLLAPESSPAWQVFVADMNSDAVADGEDLALFVAAVGP